MEINEVVIVVLCSLVNVYTLYRFYNYIFNKNKYNRKIEFISYLSYWVLNNVVHFYLNIPIVNLVLNLLAFYLLTMNYRGQQKQKIFSAVFFYLTLSMIEGMVVFVTSKFAIHIFEENPYDFIVGQIFISIFVYTFTEILIQRKNVKQQVNLPTAYILGLLVTPICSFCIITYMSSLHSGKMFGLSVCCLLVLWINLAVFYLYDKIIVHVAEQKEREMLVQKNRDYHRIIENMKVSVESTRRLKHDLKNHAVAMESLLKAKKYDELDFYLKKIFRDVSGNYIDTGNITVDSILNFKIQECKNKNIVFDPITAIPPDLTVSYDALTIILGNLLDNAIEATDEVEEDRVIGFRLFYEVGCLYLDMENPYRGALKLERGEYHTTKPTGEFHGCGLKNVKEAIEQNGGHLSIETKDQRFIVHIVLATH